VSEQFVFTDFERGERQALLKLRTFITKHGTKEVDQYAAQRLHDIRQDATRSRTEREQLNREGLASYWQPIETAPKDGTPVLIYEPGTPPQMGLQMVVAHYDGHWGPEHRWRGTYGDGDASWNPTHWMPLPPRPIS
jgi:hypothetical protein